MIITIAAPPHKLSLPFGPLKNQARCHSIRIIETQHLGVAQHRMIQIMQQYWVSSIMTDYDDLDVV